MASPGKIENYAYQQPGTTTVKLYNFEIAKFDLKQEHSNFLINVVAPILRKGGSLSVMGLASRTGSDAFNQSLSENRLKAVIALLRRHVPNNFQVTVDFAMGERAAAFAGVKDGVEQENWRAVVLSVWDKPTPPPPPPSPAPEPEPEKVLNRLYVYDKSDGFIAQMASTRSGVKLGVSSLEELMAGLDDLIFSKHSVFNRAVFDTHGSEGAIYFDGKRLGIVELITKLDNRGFDHLFPVYSKLYFSGCNVSDLGAGWAFLEIAADVFLKGHGGICLAWDSLAVGFNFPGRWADIQPRHWWGALRIYAREPGGKSWRYNGDDVLGDILAGGARRANMMKVFRLLKSF